MKSIGLRGRIVLALVGLNIVVSGLLAFFTDASAGRLFRESFLNDKLALVQAIAASIDGDVHARFTDRAAVSMPEYRRYLAYLHSVEIRDPSITYLYTVVTDPGTGDLRYAVDADILDADSLWVESEHFALQLFWRAGQPVVVYNQEEHAPGFPVEVRAGVSLRLDLRQEGETESLRLGDTELMKIVSHKPLHAISAAGAVDGEHREVVLQTDVAGENGKLYLSFSAAGESTSTPGSAYVDTPEGIERMRTLLREDRDYVETSARQDNYGTSRSAYAVIHDHEGRPAGAVVVNFYQQQLDAFQARLRLIVILVATLTFLVILAATILLTQYVVRPVRSLRAAVERVARGDLATRLDLHRHDELGQVAEGFNEMVAALVHHAAERDAAAAELARLAYGDSLTGLPNRTSFHDHLDEQLSMARRSTHEKLRAVFFMDLDRFKDVNDTLGHPMGDKVLKAAGRRIREAVRGSDLVFRQGGDEFTVILTTLHEEADAAVVAEKLVKAFAAPFLIDGNELHVGLSVGIALAPRDGTTREELVKAADTALFAAKSERGSYRFHTRLMQEKASEKLFMINRLHQGIAGAQFALHFQPVVDCAGLLLGCEALLRWSHPEIGAIPPGSFIPLAEETGLIVPLGRLGIQVACRLLRRLSDAGDTTTRVAVNLSAKQLRDEALPEDVDAALRACTADPGRLELEITESGLMDEPEAIPRIQQFRARGIRFAIDDFGTGYSSLSRLRTLPIDTLKIDRSFVIGASEDSKNADLVRAIVGIAHSFGQLVCAEGVETAAQFEFLRAAGCDALQGFYFSRPVPEETFMAIAGRRTSLGGT